MLLQTFNRVFIVAGFYINRNYIVTNLCEQRDSSNNCCQGKCHLRKRMNEEDRKDQSAFPNSSKEQEELQYIQDRSPSVAVPPPLLGQILIISESIAQDPSGSAIFHPPQFLN